MLKSRWPEVSGNESSAHLANRRLLERQKHEWKNIEQKNERKRGKCGMRRAERAISRGKPAAGWNSLVDRIYGTGGDSRATPPISTHLRPIRGESFSFRRGE